MLGNRPIASQSIAGDEVIAEATASGTISLTGAATATHGVKATAAATLSYSGAATATHGVAGTASGTISLTGAAVASHGVAGTAAGVLSYSGTATASQGVAATAAAVLVYTAAATGTHGVAGAAAGTVSLVGAADSVLGYEGTAAPVVLPSGAAAGDHGVVGDAAGIVSFFGSEAVGVKEIRVPHVIAAGSFLGRVTPRRQIAPGAPGEAEGWISAEGRAEGVHGVGFGFARASLSFGGAARGLVFDAAPTTPMPAASRGAGLVLLAGGATGESAPRDWTAYDNDWVLMLEAA